MALLLQRARPRIPGAGAANHWQRLQGKAMQGKPRQAQKYFILYVSIICT
jgi:hypothetical protein